MEYCSFEILALAKPSCFHNVFSCLDPLMKHSNSLFTYNVYTMIHMSFRCSVSDRCYLKARKGLHGSPTDINFLLPTNWTCVRILGHKSRRNPDSPNKNCDNILLDRVSNRRNRKYALVFAEPLWNKRLFDLKKRLPAVYLEQRFSIRYPVKMMRHQP